MTASEDLAGPGGVRLVDRPEHVGGFEVAEDRGMGWICSADPRTPVDGCEWIVLVEVDRGADVGRDDAVVNADAIDLDAKADGDAELFEVACSGDGGGSSPALSEENQAGIGFFVGIKLPVVVRVECLADELERKGSMVVGDGFGIYAWCLAEFENELANAAV